VDGKTSEKELTFIEHYVDKTNKNDRPEWYLVRGKTRDPLKKIDKENIITKKSSLQFLLAFSVFNKLYSDKTKAWLTAEGESIKETELTALLQVLKKFIESVNIAALSNEDLLSKSEISQLFMIVDFGSPPPPEIVMGNINDCKDNKELNKFINSRIQRAKHISSIYLTSWGELFCKSYAGINCMPRCINDLSTQLSPERIEGLDFLKLFIPSGRKEILKVPWMNKFISRSLKIRATDHVGKTTS
jgi:adenylate cyclase